MMHLKIYIHCPTCTLHFDLLTYYPLCKRIWDPETTSKLKKVWTLSHLSGPADVSHCLFFAKSNHIIHACHCHLNTSLICPRIRMVIQLISTSVLTSPPYCTNYDSTYLQHFAVKMHEYRWGSELKVAIWHQMCINAKKYFERKNTIGWSEAGQLQMDQSPATFCLKFVFCLQCTSGMFMSSTFSTV